MTSHPPPDPVRRTEAVCPHCRLSLTSDAPSGSLICAACGRAYPVIGDRLPLLIEEAAGYVAAQRGILAYMAEQGRTAAQRYRRCADETRIRSGTLREISAGLAHNAGMMEALAHLLPASESAAPAGAPVVGADPLLCLRRDWSGADESEAELRVALNAVTGALSGEPAGRVLVLGAGTGRLLADLDARFPGAIGIDLSFPMAALFLRLDVEGQIAAYQLLIGNFLRGADECERFVARRAVSPGKPALLVADATRMPFRDGAFDVVVSPFFTDLAPLSRLLPEVQRVLKPQGRFLHFGPLGYAFPDVTEHYAVDQLPEALLRHGFAMEHREVVRNTFFANTRRLNRFDFDNLLFVARRTGGPPTRGGEPQPASDRTGRDRGQQEKRVPGRDSDGLPPASDD